MLKKKCIVRKGERAPRNLKYDIQLIFFQKKHWKMNSINLSENGTEGEDGK